MLTTIPFSGFYESLWNGEIDREEDQLINYLLGENDSGEGVEEFKKFTRREVAEALFWVISYNIIHTQIARDYAGYFSDELDKECGWKVGLTFDVVDSPREYNFTTDRIFMEIPEESVKRIYEECSGDVLASITKKRFTSREGFISFYSADFTDWGDVTEWDHNQVGTLLDAWIATKEIDISEDTGIERLSGNGYIANAVDAGYTTEKLLERLNQE